MKKKKIKKISELIVAEIRKTESGIKLKSEFNDYSDYDPSVSEKVKDLIINLIQWKENVGINVSDSRFTISINDIRSVKGLKNTKYDEDNFVEISVNSFGFSINNGYHRRCNFKDDSLFSELNPIIIKRVSEINRENFMEIWESILKDSGIIRDNNLNQLFNE